MPLDNKKFIARHEQSPDKKIPKIKQKRSYAGISIILVFLLFAGTFSYLAWFFKTDDMARNIAQFALAASLISGYVVYRSFRGAIMRQKQLELVNEVMEGSRGTRLITDDKGRTIFSNKKMDELCHGMGAPSLKTLTKIFESVPESLQQLHSLQDYAERGMSDTVELLAHIDDRERWFTLTAQPVKKHQGFVHWRMDDVTQRHIVDRAIREEREKLIDFTDNAPVGFFSVDEAGRFLFANATFARWIGEDLRTLLEQGTLHRYLVAPPEGANPYDISQEPSPRQVIELRMKGPAGKTFLASINQVIVKEDEGRVRTRAVVHDLTSEREMRKALQASEDKFERFFEEAPLGIVQLDKKRTVMDCNQAFVTMLGTTIGMLQATKFEDLIDEDNVPEVQKTLEKIESGEDADLPLEITLNSANDKITVQMYGRRFREGKNIVLHFIDVTEQKSLEEQFVQSQKMQAIGQLAGGVAHDFNNLLTAIIGFSDLLLLRHKPGDPSFSDIMQIKQNSNRAANLVRQLLAFSRQQTMSQRVHDITDILTEISHLLRRLIGASIELDLVHGKDLGLVKVDEGQMEQVLINLAVNARDAMDGLGHLIIKTENIITEKPKELISEELPPGEWVVIKVIDTGTGIDKEIMPRIFEPFLTTKDVGHGTGLGLATVYGIIRQTGGFLDVQSKSGEGTTFLLYLPRAEEDEVDEREETFEEEITRDLTGTERILLVEDEDAVRMFSQRALTNKGYEVLSAESGEAALELIHANEDKHLDLIVTDVVMPNMDGPTLAQRIRQDNADLKVIFMSGYTEDKLKDYMAPNTYFLPKPFTLKALAAKVKEVLED